MKTTTKKNEIFTKWRHKNISKHYLDLCAIRVFVSTLMYINTTVFQLHFFFFGFECRALAHYEMLTSTIDNKILPKEEKGKNVDKADPNVEDKNSAIFLVSKYVNADIS